MSPADLIEFTKVKLRDGSEVKAYVEGQKPPVSRETLLHMVLAANLLLEETESGMPPRERRRSELLRERLQDAIEREGRQ